MPVSLTDSYTGPPAWTVNRVFTDWQVEPTVLALAALASAVYLVGLARSRGRGERWAPGRTAAFAFGIGLWVFTCCSGIGVYERVLFTDRAVQAVVLLMVVPLFLAMGAPVTVMIEAFPQGWQRWIRTRLAGRTSRVLMFPLVSTVLLVTPPWLLYFTAWYRLSVTTSGYNTLFHVAFVLFGLAYFWPRLQIDPVGHRYHPLIGVVITVAEVICDAALGATLVFGSHLLVPDYWAALHRPWGMTTRSDQSWGGAVLWGLGDIAGVPFLVAMIIQVVREETVRTAQTDWELDAQYAEADADADADADVVRPRDADGGVQGPEALTAPWWESDPRFTHLHPDAEAR